MKSFLFAFGLPPVYHIIWLVSNRALSERPMIIQYPEVWPKKGGGILCSETFPNSPRLQVALELCVMSGFSLKDFFSFQGYIFKTYVICIELKCGIRA